MVSSHGPYLRKSQTDQLQTTNSAEIYANTAHVELHDFSLSRNLFIYKF